MTQTDKKELFQTLSLPRVQMRHWQFVVTGRVIDVVKTNYKRPRPWWADYVSFAQLNRTADYVAC